MQKKSTKKQPAVSTRARVNRLKQVYYNLSGRLCYVLTRGEDKFKYLTAYYDVATDGERTELRREIASLADSLSIDRKDITLGDTFIEAIKRLGGSHWDSPAARRVFELLAEIDERADKLQAEHRGPLKADATSAPQSRRQTRKLSSERPNLFATFGLLDGDVCEWEETDDIRPGEIVRFEEVGEDYIARLVSLDDETLTVVNTRGEEVESDRADVSELRRLVSYTRKVTLARTDTAAEGAPGVAPARVIYLGAWIDSHPRPIRNLLFAEKQ